MTNTTFYFLTIGIPVVAVMIVIAVIGRSRIKCGMTGGKMCGMTKEGSGIKGACKGMSGAEKKKQENLAKIEKLLGTKSKITNNDVEKMLGVSDATAERYLNQLEKSGKLKQKGKGPSTYYTK